MSMLEILTVIRRRRRSGQPAGNAGARTRRVALGAVTLLSFAGIAHPTTAAHAASLSRTFQVASKADTPDANAGDGVCADATHVCTLRAATQEANAEPSGTMISIIVPLGTYTLTLGPLSLTANTVAIHSGGVGTAMPTITAGKQSQVLLVSAPASVTLDRLLITGGNSIVGGGNGLGGGVDNTGTLTLSSSTVQGNFGIDGDGLYNGGTMMVTDSTITGNDARPSGGFGGGIYNDGGTLTVRRSSILQNTAGAGAGIYNTDGTVTVANTRLSSNSAQANGGAITSNAGTLTVLNSSLSTNVAGTDGGGAIANGGTLILTGSTLSGNTTSANGGAILNVGTVTATNSTISNNRAGSGGGIWTDRSVVLTYVTIAFNSTGIVGGGAVQATGTIVANSENGANCVNGVLGETTGFNLDSGTTCGFTKPTDLVNTDPMLGPLAGNGGPTPTHALLPGSPAIDAGGTSASRCPATDQRGVSRPQGPACDIGAFELVQ